MAITEIHAIFQTPKNAIHYVMADKTETALREDVHPRIAYSVDEKTGEVTYYTLSTCQWCAHMDEPEWDFQRLIDYFGQRELRLGCARSKTGEAIVAWHLTQSFDGQIDPRIANEIGRELAEKVFPGHPAVISTHTNTTQIHNHIVACAWNRDGEKYNSCHATYQDIRRWSDELCARYGLRVLERTRDQKLIRWTDSRGKVRYFEPTARKEALRRQRKEGRCSSGDVSSYRNTLAYEVKEKRKETNRAIARQAIEEELPFAASYDDLLARLWERGFDIKGKKKNGEWYSSVTFKSPIADRGVRDTSLGDGYTREQLTARIAKQKEERQAAAEMQKKLRLPVYEDDDYAKMGDVQQLSEEYRAYHDRGGCIRVEARTEPQKTLLRDIKQADAELYGLIDTTRLQQLIAESRSKKKTPGNRTREAVLIARIQESFENLRFMEQRGICTNQEVAEKVSLLQRQIQICEEKLGRAERMMEQQQDPDKVQEYTQRIEQLRDGLEELRLELSRYERCMATLNRIESERTMRNAPMPEKKKRHGEYER